MANFKQETFDLVVNEVSGGNYWFFIYDEIKMKLKKDIVFVEPESKEKTQTKWTIFASDTEKECIDRKIELGLT